MDDNKYRGVTKETIENLKSELYDKIELAALIGGHSMTFIYEEMLGMIPDAISLSDKKEIIYQTLTEMSNEGFLSSLLKCDPPGRWIEIEWPRCGFVEMK